MQIIQLELPDEPLFSLKRTATEFAQDLKLLAAVKLFELGRLSSGRAAQLAGLSRVAFLLKLKEYRVSPFALTLEELRQEVENA